MGSNTIPDAPVKDMPKNAFTKGVLTKDAFTKDTPAKLGVMGGTFDPIHIAHLRIAEEVREALNLDLVLFVPAGNPVFKHNRVVTDPEIRFASVQAAVADNPFFEASRIEIDRAGDTFTVDTLRELHNLYPNSELYFIIGSDAALEIGKWREVTEVARFAHLAVAVGRPGFAQANELRESILAAAPFDLHLVQVTALEISSTDIRKRLTEGCSVRYLVPEIISSVGKTSCMQKTGHVSVVSTVQRSISENSISMVSVSVNNSIASNGSVNSASESGVIVHRDWSLITGDESALSNEFYNARKEELVNRVGSSRFEHIKGVAKTAKKLAQRYGLDKRKARLAGLLHDWDKALDDDQARARVRELGLEDSIDPWVLKHMPRVLHGHTAAAALARDYPEIPGDVLQAIDRHTTAAENMSDLDKVLYIADALEPGRQFGRINDLRTAAKTVTLDDLYFQTYEYWILLLFERRQPLHPDTMRIWNANALRWQAEKEKRRR